MLPVRPGYRGPWGTRPFSVCGAEPPAASALGAPGRPGRGCARACQLVSCRAEAEPDVCMRRQRQTFRSQLAVAVRAQSGHAVTGDWPVVSFRPPAELQISLVGARRSAFCPAFSCALYSCMIRCLDGPRKEFEIASWCQLSRPTANHGQPRAPGAPGSAAGVRHRRTELVRRAPCASTPSTPSRASRVGLYSKSLFRHPAIGCRSRNRAALSNSATG